MGWRDIFRSKAPALSETYPEQATDSVVTYDVSQHWQSVLDGKRWNPDDLVGSKGLTIYSKMLVDEQVKSVTEFKLNAILGRGYQFKFGKTNLSETEQAERIAVFEAVLKRMRGSFVDALEGVASGREYGFSITEKVYGEIEVESKTFTGINMLLTRDPCSFDFYADDYGLLKKIEQRVSNRTPITVERSKVIHYVHKPKWDMIYGRSELRSAYRAWYAKDQLVKLWLLHLEKFGSGVWVASQDSDSNLNYGSKEYTALQTALTNVRALASIILPKGVTGTVEFPTSTDQYEKALQYFDLAIAKSQLVPNLLGLSHTGQTGAYAQSQTQFEAFFWTTSADGSRLAECLNEELFRDLGDQNWGDGDYPSFCFKPVSMEHAKWMLTTWKDLLGVKAVISTEEDERIIRQMLEMPERDPDAEPLVDPMADRQQTHTEEQAEIANERADKEMAMREKEAAKKAMMSMQEQIDELKTKLSSAVNVTVHNPRELFWSPSQPRAKDGKWVDTGADDEGGAGGGGSLTEDEMVAVTSYTEDGYKYVNPYVAGKTSGMSDGVREQAAYEAKHLESAINKSPLSQDAVLYRGFSNPSVAANAEKLVGREIGSDKFLSTSRDESTARSFATTNGKGAVVFEITARAGTKGIDVDMVRGQRKTAESEVILSHRTRLRVTGSRRVGGISYVSAEVIQ